MIRLSGIGYTYSDGTVALDDVSVTLEFADGEHITAIVGQSGSGKTTLLQCIAGFLAPRQGRIEIDGKDVGELGEREFRKKLGVVFQDLSIIDSECLNSTC